MDADIRTTYTDVTDMNLFESYNLRCEDAFVIYLPGNPSSQKLFQRALASCKAVGQKATMWAGYDGTGKTIEPHPDEPSIMNAIKIKNHYLTRGEIACALSHISLWAKCIEEDQPIVILEHDAIMLKKYEYHNLYNSICYLGGKEQYEGSMPIFPTPPHASDGPNFHSICRAHAYAIDPAVARNMLAYVIQHGINNSLDFILRADLFNIHQMGLFAYDSPDGTTIPNRSDDGNKFLKERNDSLNT